MDLTKREVQAVLTAVASSLEGVAGLIVYSTPLSPRVTPEEVKHIQWTTEVAGRLLHASRALRGLGVRLQAPEVPADRDKDESAPEDAEQTPS